MTRYDKQTLGFKPESTYGTDPIALASTEYWKFGRYTLPWGDMPAESRPLTTQTTGADVMPQDIYFAQYFANYPIVTTAINAIPFYYTLGSVVNAGAGDPYTHTITPRAVGADIPSFTTRSEDANDSVGIYESIPGSYIQNLVYTHDFTGPQPSVYNINAYGKRIETPQFVGASNAGSLVAPGGVEDQYKRDGNFACRWNATFSSGQYASGGDDLSDDIMAFTLAVNNTLVPDKPQSQDYPDNFLIGDLNAVVSFDLYRRGSVTKNVHDDFITMQDNSTKMNMHYKIYQDATHYIQIDMSNIMLSEPKRNNTIGTGTKAFMRYTGTVSDLNIQSVDALAGATYYA